MIKAKAEHTELSDGSKVYGLTIYGHDGEVSIPCYSREAAERFRKEIEMLIFRYGL